MDRWGPRFIVPIDGDAGLTEIVSESLPVHGLIQVAQVARSGEERSTVAGARRWRRRRTVPYGE